MGGPKGRRRKEGGFLGAERILKPDGKLQKVARKRVGIKGMKAPAREGAEIYDAEGETKIGDVTSGTFSPCLKGMSDELDWPLLFNAAENAHQFIISIAQRQSPWGTWKHRCPRLGRK